MREIFDEDTLEEAFDRQLGRCGACGQRLVWRHHEENQTGAWEGHHFDPEGDDSVGNCVCLGINCSSSGNHHLEPGHKGDFGGDEVATTDELPYSRL